MLYVQFLAAVILYNSIFFAHLHRIIFIWPKCVSPQGNQPCIFTGRTYAEAEAPVLWPPIAKNWLIRKDPDSGKEGRGEGDDRGWDGWMASLTQWTWVSVGWWGTEKPGVLQFMGSQSQTWLSNWTATASIWTSLPGHFRRQRGGCTCECLEV